MIPYSNSWGGCQRMFFLAQQLSENNFNPIFICRKKNNYNIFGVKPNFKIIAIDMNGLMTEVKNYEDSKKKNINFKQNIYNRIFKSIKNLKNLRRIIFFYLRANYNDPSLVDGYISWKWAKVASKNIKKIIDKNCIKSIIISGPPFGVYRLISILRKYNPDINLNMDYRDPWNLWKKGGIIANIKEKTALKICNTITVTTKEMKIELCKKFKVPLNKIRIISNGYSENTWKQINKKSSINTNGIIFTYIGSISIELKNSYRNPQILIDSFIDALKINPNIYLIFVGVVDINCYSVKLFESLTESHIKFLPTVSHKESLLYMNNSDILIQIHTDNYNSGKYLISGKIYDYIRAAKPILSIGKETDANQKLIKTQDIGIVINNEKEAIKEKILIMSQKSYLNRFNENLKSKILDIQKFSREYQNQKWIKEIEAIENKNQ